MAMTTRDPTPRTPPDDADVSALGIGFTPGSSALLGAAVETLIEEYERHPERARERVERWRTHPDQPIAMPAELLLEDVGGRRGHVAPHEEARAARCLRLRTMGGPRRENLRPYRASRSFRNTGSRSRPCMTSA